MEAIKQLQELGFSQYEAQAYIALLQKNPLNGYELAKASGIPRAQYLCRLTEAGRVRRGDAPDGSGRHPICPCSGG